MRDPWMEKYIDGMKTDLKADVADVRLDLAAVRSDIQKLLQFKWQIIGGSLGASFLFTVLFQIALAYWQVRSQR
jgi:hypothetical protein